MSKRKLEKGKKAIFQMPITVKSIDKENFTLTMVASTQDEDRHGDVIVQSGWDIQAFLRNPVILNSHRYDDATEVIARATRTEIVGKGKKSRLEQDWKFAVNENPKAKIIFDLYAGEFLHASSVGLIPKKFKENQDGSIDWWTIEEAELLEVSAVSVPANARALAKKKGIDVDVLGDEKGLGDEDEENAEIVIPDSEDEDEGDEDPDDDAEDEEEDAEEEAEPVIEEVETEPVVEEVDPVEPQAEPVEDVPAPEPTQASYKKRVVRVLSGMEAHQRKSVERAYGIIQKMLSEDGNPTLSKETQTQIRKRQVNQAIRALFQAKNF